MEYLGCKGCSNYIREVLGDEIRRMFTIGGMMTEAYFRRTGYKFDGTDTEFQAVVPICCGKSCPIADEEGFFSKWYCIVDWKICDKQCKNHQKPRKLDPDWEEYFVATCERYRNAN